MKKDIVELWDCTHSDIEELLNKAIRLKSLFKQGIEHTPLRGKILGLIFEKASTRTRLSFESAMIQLGGSSIFMSAKDTQLSRSEPVRDTARVMSRYVDALVLRTYSQEHIKEMAHAATIPVINGLSDLYHPCQILSDIMTIFEQKKNLSNLKITWIGDGNNMAHSWIDAAAILGLNLVLACPSGYQPKADILDRAIKQGSGKIELISDPIKAATNADVINTDVWASMGQEREASERTKAFQGYQVDAGLLKKAKPDAIVMHCLPVHRGEEISEEVLEGPNSVVWDQAENKLHMHKAILETLILQEKK